MGDSRIKDISSLLSSFFDEEKLRRGERYSDFFSSWPSVVGSRLAAHSKVADIDKGFLVVEAEHPGWIQLLQLKQTEILNAVSKRYPELGLRGIIFRLGRGGGQAQAKGKAASPTPPADEKAETDETREADEIAGAAALPRDMPQDPEFQALFASLKRTIHGKD
jgi:Protein of unknown function (DUF721).